MFQSVLRARGRTHHENTQRAVSSQHFDSPCPMISCSARRWGSCRWNTSLRTGPWGGRKFLLPEDPGTISQGKLPLLQQLWLLRCRTDQRVAYSQLRREGTNAGISDPGQEVAAKVTSNWIIKAFDYVSVQVMWTQYTWPVVIQGNSRTLLRTYFDGVSKSERKKEQKGKSSKDLCSGECEWFLRNWYTLDWLS